MNRNSARMQPAITFSSVVSDKPTRNNLRRIIYCSPIKLFVEVTHHPFPLELRQWGSSYSSSSLLPVTHECSRRRAAVSGSSVSAPSENVRWKTTGQASRNTRLSAFLIIMNIVGQSLHVPRYLSIVFSYRPRQYETQSWMMLTLAGHTLQQ
jgi:hypothetical protein